MSLKVGRDMSLNEKPAEILIIEDNEDDFEAAERALRSEAGLTSPIRHCLDGAEAWAYLTGTGRFAPPDQPRRPSLILLDLNMPGLDGRRLLERLKQDGALRSIPVVIMTTSAAESDVAQCYAVGANSFMQKPVSWTEFTEAIRNLRRFWLQTAILPKVEQI